VAVDLIIRGGRVVTPMGTVEADIAIDGGRFVAVGEVTDTAAETIDATGRHLFPGLIDPHVHFNEPGRAEWEGFATGSAALAAGGGTCFFDMPLNSEPPLLDAAAFDAKRAAAEASSRTDFALWGGLTPGNLHQLEALAERGVVGFKAFMCDSGIESFPRADHDTLWRGLSVAADLGLPVAVHAEDQELITGGTRRVRQRSEAAGMAQWSASRSAAAEDVAVLTAMRLAAVSFADLHIVHASDPAVVSLVRQGLQDGVSVSCETCPHYLLLSEQDAAAVGPRAKCAPPLRGERRRQKLIDQLRSGRIDFVGSDHSPCPPAMKNGNAFEAWGGIAGVQSTRSALLSLEPALPAETVARLTATAAATRFSLPDKGKIEVGYDADLALVMLDATYELTAEMLLDRHKMSPYVGRRFRGRVEQTLLRGRTIFRAGQIIGEPGGRLIKPIRRSASGGESS
jgi:allantoinase